MVHDLRVALRRLRNMLSLFAPYLGQSSATTRHPVASLASCSWANFRLKEPHAPAWSYAGRDGWVGLHRASEAMGGINGKVFLCQLACACCGHCLCGADLSKELAPKQVSRLLRALGVVRDTGAMMVRPGYTTACSAVVRLHSDVDAGRSKTAEGLPVSVGRWHLSLE